MTTAEALKKLPAIAILCVALASAAAAQEGGRMGGGGLGGSGAARDNADYSFSAMPAGRGAPSIIDQHAAGS